ncbi:MAG TPA: TonB-dependent receptor, partial [Polyangiaceae bacterium]|nr:TonB-dependent receptor [Polyangiaceae bacterium]
QRDFTSQGVQTRLDWAAVTGPLEHRIEAGLRFHHDQVERRHSEDAFLLVGGEPFPEGSATTVTTINRSWTYAIAGHAMDAITWRSLTVTPGIRIEAVRSGLDNRFDGTSVQRWTVPFLPGVGAFYGIVDGLGVLGGVYRGFSPPVPGSSSDIKPELSINYEGGARYTNRWARVEAIGFYNDYQNLTDVCSFSSGCNDADLDRQFDAGKARIYGVEAFADVSPKVGPLTLPLSVAYTLTRTKFLNSFSSDDPIFGTVEKGDEMPYVPRHQLTVTPGVEHQQVGGSVSLRYVSRMREEPGSGAISSGLATDKQLTFDAAAYYQALQWLRIYASAINVLNAHDIVSRRPFGARPNTPRWVHVGAKVAF